MTADEKALFKIELKSETKAEVERALNEQFLLIPKNKLFHVVGGAVAGIVAAVGISCATLYGFIRSGPAEMARKNIIGIETEAKQRLAELKADDNYLRSGDKISIQHQLNQGGKARPAFLSIGKPAAYGQATDVKLVETPGPDEVLQLKKHP